MGIAARPVKRETTVADWRQLDSLELTPILAATLDSFYEKGFHGAAVREIAKKTGMAVTALYYRYESKEGLLIALLELSTSDVMSQANAARADGGDDPVQQLANVVEAIVLRITNRPRLVALEGEVRYLSPENRQRYRDVRKTLEKLLFSIIQNGVARGVFEVEDPTEATRAVLGMCQSIPRWYHQDGELEPDVVARRYMRIALQAVGTAPATLRAVTEASVAASERSSARTAARAAKRTEI